MITKLDKAIRLAECKHAGQYRNNSNIPYITHPLAVLRLLTHMNIVDENILVASVLHDILEDTDCKPEVISMMFGEEVLSVVKELTRPDCITEFEDKKGYLDSFANTASTQALIIKFADRVVNVTDYFYTDSKYAIRYAKQANKVFLKVLTVYSDNKKVESVFKNLSKTLGVFSMEIINDASTV